LIRTWISAKVDVIEMKWKDSQMIKEQIYSTLKIENFEVEQLIDIKLVFETAVRKWFADNGDEELLQCCALNHNSVVIEVGGYEGVWSEVIHKKYRPKLYILEPVEAFYNTLEAKFCSHSEVKLFKNGLGDEGVFKIKHSSDGTSLFSKDVKLSKKILKSLKFKNLYAMIKNRTEEINIISFDNFISQTGLQQIDLIQINIEGAEFQLMPQILEHPILNKIKRIQVQYHIGKVENAVERRNAIRNRLRMTHKEIFNYPFVWEAWELNT